jgi:molecular chaperone GrpE
MADPKQPDDPSPAPGAGAASPDNPATAPGSSAPNGHGSPPTAAGDPLLARMAELEAQLAEASDAHLRARAEVENVRRRGEEETSKARKFAIDAFAESLLPVRDSLEAALVNAKGAPDKLLEGVETTLRQLTSAFERNRVAEVAPPAGTKFDPHQHQAISAVPSEQEPNTIVSVLQKGYLINDRVLRPALVTVSAPKA